MYFSRPLTQDELAQRRERARRKHSEMLSAKKTDEAEDVTTSSQPKTIDENTTTTVDGQQELSQIDGTSEFSSGTENPSEPPDQFIAFARVYSGVIKKGQKLFVLGPKHEPSTEDVMNDDEEEDFNEQIYSQ